jgi:predicted nucleotidyltransferase
LEQYEAADTSSRRFDLAGEVENVTYETAGAYLLGRDVRENASNKAVTLVKDFMEQVADEFHAVVNTILKPGDSETRRRAVFKLIEVFRKGLA